MYNLGDQFKRKQECGKANEKCINLWQDQSIHMFQIVITAVLILL